MTEQQTISWESGPSAAPLPPLVDPRDMPTVERPMLALYRTYGPIFQLARPGKDPHIILAGPEANVFMTRHEDEFFTTKDHWKQFDATCLL